MPSLVAHLSKRRISQCTWTSVRDSCIGVNEWRRAKSTGVNIQHMQQPPAFVGRLICITALPRCSMSGHNMFVVMQRASAHHTFRPPAG